MPITRRHFRLFAITVSALAVLVAAGMLILPKYLDLDTYREQIIAELQSALNRPVSYESGNLSFSFGPAVTFKKFVVMEPDGSDRFISVEKFTCQIDLIQLLSRHLSVDGIVAEKPVIRIERKPDGRYNFSDLLEKSSGEYKSSIGDIRVSNGTVTLVDKSIRQEPLVSTVGNIALSLDHIGWGKRNHFKLSAAIGNGSGGTVSTHGRLRLPKKGKPLDDATLDAELSLKGVQAEQFWPYLSKKLPFKKMVGSVSTESSIKGKLSDFKISGKASAGSVIFDYQPIFHAALTPKSIKVKYNIAVNSRDINISAVEANIDGAVVNGSCAIREYRSADPRITAQAVTNELNYAKFNQYIPYGIIVKHVATWIEQHIKGGIYRLVDGRLDGRISQILHMEKDQNYNVLLINARVEKGVVSYGDSVPQFHNIKGALELKGKDFSLHGMSGQFGNAPLTLEGKITDYPLDSPSAYPFNMTISPGKPEIAWLIGKNQAGRLQYGGSSTLHLTGDGYFTEYHLAGDWNLTPASYSYSDTVSKPVGTASSANFKATLNGKEAKLARARYNLSGLSLDISGKYPFEKDKGAEISISSNSFQAESLAQLSRHFAEYQPSGRMQISITGTQPKSGGDFRWKGSAALNNASIRYSPSAQPFSAITGNLIFDENSAESSQLSARIGKTTLSGKVAVGSISPLAFSASVVSPRVELTDFGFRTADPQPRLTKLKADFSYRNSTVSIKSLSGYVNSSQLAVKGEISDLESFRADIAVTSPQIDIADLILFSGIDRINPSGKAATPPYLKATLKADSGVFNGVIFNNLTATSLLSNRIFQLQSADADIFNGKLTLKGKIIGQTTPTQYQGEMKLSNASASELIHIFSVQKREMTGTVNLSADIMAKGDSPAELKKSASGGIKLYSSRGMLRQFSGLSKVFSILNISQLLRFRLPDMVSEGMPYNDIKATFAIRDGMISTNDLFISSNAMNISMVGKHDFINDNLDFIVGIQPLQTVDKVVSKIPIVGWILTGKEKTLITAYFEVKGKSSAPNVSAIPVSSIGQGVLGIFKRIFQLPAKLFTDTGEVILGQ